MRLNSENRQSIANRAMKSKAFEDRETELAFRSNALAVEVYGFLFAAVIRKAAATLNDKWVHYRTQMNVNVSGPTIALYFDKPMPLPDNHYAVVGAVGAGELADRIMAYANDREALKQDREKAKAAVWALLNNVSTLESLQKVWPEGQQFYSDLEIRKPDLPSVIGADINKILGVA